MTRRRRELAERLDRIEHAVDHISRSIEKIEIATIVRDPSSKLSSDAYDGLRKQVVAAAAERTAHLYQIARFAEASAPVPELSTLVREWMDQADLIRLDEFDERYFDVLGGEGNAMRTLRPAYVDRLTGRPTLMGQAERVPDGPPEVALGSRRRRRSDTDPIVVRDDQQEVPR